MLRSRYNILPDWGPAKLIMPHLHQRNQLFNYIMYIVIAKRTFRALSAPAMNASLWSLFVVVHSFHSDVFVWRLSVWRLSVAYIGPNSRAYRKTKIGTEVAHITRDSDTLSRSKGQRSRSPVRFTHRGLLINAWGRCTGDRENVLGVGNYCYVASACYITS